MRYRRLGQTDLMVSELGLEVRAALAGGPDETEATLRAAIDGGVTVFAWDVSDATEDVEPLVIRAAGVDRGRLTLVAALDFLPAPEEIGPQVEAIAARLEEGSGLEGYLDVVALPGLPDAAQLAALDEVRRRGILRFAAVAGESDAGLPAALPSGLDVLVLGAAGRHRQGVGVLARAEPREAPALLEGGAVACVVTSALGAGEVSRLIGARY